MAADHSRQPSKQAPTHRLDISLTIEADYRKRGVFPRLRSDAAEKRTGTNLRFTVPLKFARAVQKDAKARREEATRGMAHAYSALISQLRIALDHGDLDDPGEAPQQLAAAAAPSPGGKPRPPRVLIE